MKNLVFVIVAILMLTCCTTTKYVPVIETKVDSIYVAKLSVDTFRTTDSVYIEKKGDTIIKLQKSYVYKVKEIRDTMLVETRDTLTQFYPVERMQTISEKVYITLGKIFCLLLFIIIAIFIYRYRFLNKK